MKQKQNLTKRKLKRERIIKVRRKYFIKQIGNIVLRLNHSLFQVINFGNHGHLGF
jgi:hypothetical protein